MIADYRSLTLPAPDGPTPVLNKMFIRRSMKRATGIGSDGFKSGTAFRQPADWMVKINIVDKTPKII
jgi:hypothetical protein